MNKPASFLFQMLARRTRAFTLVEVLIVVAMLALLVGAIVTQAVDACVTADEGVLRHNLGVIRSAIQRYRFDNAGALPGQDQRNDIFKAELAPYLPHGFPVNPFDANGQHADWVHIDRRGEPLPNYAGGETGWRYDNLTGQFIANTGAISCDGVTKYCEF